MDISTTSSQKLSWTYNLHLLPLPGRPLPHQPPPDAHQLLPVCHGHHHVLLCSHKGTAWQGATGQPRLLPREGTWVPSRARWPAQVDTVQRSPTCDWSTSQSNHAASSLLLLLLNVGQGAGGLREVLLFTVGGAFSFNMEEMRVSVSTSVNGINILKNGFKMCWKIKKKTFL